LRLPLIDLDPYLSGAPGSLRRTAAQVGAASRTLGAYFVANHGVPESLVERVFRDSARFHHLPMRRKLAVRGAFDKGVGYLPPGDRAPAPSSYGSSRVPDACASYFVQRHEAGVPDANRWIGGLPGFKETMQAYLDAMAALARHLLGLQSVALGLPENFLNRQPAFSPPEQRLRLLHYPPREATAAGQFGLRPHTDLGYLTILAQGGVEGLEVLSRSRRWIPVPAPAGHLVVSNSDMCELWSNGRFRAAPHRVINKGAAERFAIAFLAAPRPDVRVDCWPGCENSRRGRAPAPRSFADHFAAKLQREAAS